MGFRARKSIKVMPGVRMTVTPRGVSTSVGTRGARVSVHSSGRVTRTVGIPGSGISHVSTSRMGSGGGSHRRTSAKAPHSAPRPTRVAAAKPGLFAPAWEKQLFAAMSKHEYQNIRSIAYEFPEARPTAAVLEALLVALPAGDTATLRANLGWLWESGRNVESDSFISKYVAQAGVTVHVAEGISISMPLTTQALDLLFVEALQAEGQMDEAIERAEHLDPSTSAAVSLAELYIEAGRFADVVDLTNGLANEDEPSTFLLIQRGRALREQGYADAALEAFKEALRPRSRPAELRNAAYVERAHTYLAQGKKGMAKKDLERVLAVDGNYPGLRELLANLGRQD